jgi:hypothetical protein
MVPDSLTRLIDQRQRRNDRKQGSLQEAQDTGEEHDDD